MKCNAKTPEGRLRQFCILKALQHGHDADWVRERATELFDIPPAEGFCLTALSKPQLVQLADHVVTLTGGTPGPHRRGSRLAANGSILRDRTGAVTYLLTRPQRDLIISLAREVFGEYLGSQSPFAGFLAGLCKRSEIRLLSRDQARKVIDALTDMQRRGWHPSDRATEPQRSEPQSGAGQ